MSIKFGASILAGAVGLITTMGAAEQARASGFELREQTSEGIGTSFAGQTAEANNASTIYYNPAGMTLLQGNQTAASVTEIVPEVSFSGKDIGAGLVREVIGSYGGNLTPAAPVPAGYAMWDFQPNLKFGVALTSPFGERTDYADGWVGRYQALRTELTNINVSPSAAYRFNEHFSVGAAVQIAYFNAVLSNAINLPGLGLAPFDAKQTLAGNGIGVGGDIGFMYELDPATRVGFNYRSRIHYDLSGGTSIQAPNYLTGASPTFQNSGASVGLTTPDFFNLGFYRDVTPQIAMMADVQFTTWSVLQQLNVNYDNGRPASVIAENWRNTWFGSVGASYAWSPQMKFLVGVGYDESPITDQTRTARLPDTNRLLVSGGVSYQLNQYIKANLAYQHIFTNGAVINQMGAAGAGLLQGFYTSSANLISVSAEVRF
jgi:long-chain fatty acid transport protein